MGRVKPMKTLRSVYWTAQSMAEFLNDESFCRPDKNANSETNERGGRSRLPEDKDTVIANLLEERDILVEASDELKQANDRLEKRVIVQQHESDELRRANKRLIRELEDFKSTRELDVFRAVASATPSNASGLSPKSVTFDDVPILSSRNIKRTPRNESDQESLSSARAESTRMATQRFNYLEQRSRQDTSPTSSKLRLNLGRVGQARGDSESSAQRLYQEPRSGKRQGGSVSPARLHAPQRLQREGSASAAQLRFNQLDERTAQRQDAPSSSAEMRFTQLEQRSARTQDVPSSAEMRFAQLEQRSARTQDVPSSAEMRFAQIEQRSARTQDAPSSAEMRFTQLEQRSARTQDVPSSAEMRFAQLEQRSARTQDVPSSSADIRFSQLEQRSAQRQDFPSSSADIRFSQLEQRSARTLDLPSSAEMCFSQLEQRSAQRQGIPASIPQLRFHELEQRSAQHDSPSPSQLGFHEQRPERPTFSPVRRQGGAVPVRTGQDVTGERSKSVLAKAAFRSAQPKVFTRVLTGTKETQGSRAPERWDSERKAASAKAKPSQLASKKMDVRDASELTAALKGGGSGWGRLLQNVK